MKITKSELRRIIRRTIVETIDIEPQTPEEKIAQLMSDPVGEPENWLQGFELGMAAGIIEVIETEDSWEGQYRVKMPFSIAQHCYRDAETIKNRRDFGYDHPFYIFPTSQYITIVVK